MRAIPDEVAHGFGEGYLYLLAGPNPYAANLWQVALASGKTVQLTHNPAPDGISNFTASPAGIVMGDALTSVDRLEALRGGKTTLVGDGTGDAPSINAAGQIVYLVDSAPPYKGQWARERVVFRATPADPPVTIYGTRKYDSVLPQWSANGSQILVTGLPVREFWAHLFIINRHGQVLRQLMTLRPPPDVLLWGPYGLTIGNFGRHGPNEIVSLSGRVRFTIPSGWTPVCWNPGGTALLVTSASQGRIGLWRPADPGTVGDTGALAVGGLTGCAWLSKPAAGAAPGRG